MTNKTFTIPAKTIKALHLNGPVSAWPDNGDWEDDNDWNWTVGIAKTTFDDATAYLVKPEDSVPNTWGCIAENMDREQAIALADLLNAIR
jgi:hypothetical protein